ncbi:MAG TPA: carbohydrate ABC transporter permease, partial [Archangium sp.]
MFRLVKRFLFGLLVLGILVYTLFPFYWAVVSSLKTGSALFEVEFWPKEPAWGNYPAVFRQGP